MLTPGQARFFGGVGALVALVMAAVLFLTVQESSARSKDAAQPDCGSCHPAQLTGHPAKRPSTTD